MVQYLPSSTREYLKNDIASLVRDFGDVTNLDSVKVQLALIREQKCPRFHVDKIPYRLLVTYTGPGTQYISKGLSNPMIIPLKSLENTLVWSLLGKFRTWVAQRISNEEYNKLAILPGAAIKECGPGEILILKGADWEGCNGAVHRSPPVDEGDLRLVLTLDTGGGGYENR
eukprot:CAMPEP_0167744274 /NCGR_PEP_ID=MMETSP0110_2-20121227/2495_1 /TAXON_ID=629695 /ORGANISM="Gymnochlora sp., Strain CCMP2014" /LENGTH=170 /DNA_ID=CAMNT_0007628767 /DNA_START=610 /DNA_END=1122 /DNA_ORIENTATION=+